MKRQGVFDVRHPFFRPFWRRLLATGLCLGWALVEWNAGADIWATVFGTAGAYLFIQFFVLFDPAEYEDRE